MIRDHFRTQGRTFGITAVTSISLSSPAAISPSRTQSSANHQSSYPRRAAAICSGCGRQVTGQAEACQIEGAKRIQTLNIGGSCATVVSFVVEAGQT